MTLLIRRQWRILIVRRLWLLFIVYVDSILILMTDILCKPVDHYKLLVLLTEGLIFQFINSLFCDINDIIIDVIMTDWHIVWWPNYYCGLFWLLYTVWPDIIMVLTVIWLKLIVLLSDEALATYCELLMADIMPVFYSLLWAVMIIIIPMIAILWRIIILRYWCGGQWRSILQLGWPDDRLAIQRSLMVAVVLLSQP